MRRIFNDLKIMIQANLWLIPVIAALVGAVFYFVSPPPPMSARMATGSDSGAYHQFAERLRDQLAKQHFTLNLVPSTGSNANLEMLLADDPKIEIALVQSGTELNLDALQKSRLESLGSMYQEPVWLFYRGDVELDRIADLTEQRVAYGGSGSSTQAVTEAIFRVNGIAREQYPQSWQELGGGKAADALQAGELDAAFFIGPAENTLVRRLASDPQLELFDFRRAKAYEARLPFLNHIDISEGLIDLANNAPSRDTTVLSPVATLVINDEFNPALVPLFMEAAREVLKDGNLLDTPGEYPKADSKTFALSKDAERYYTSGLPILQRYVPFRIASLADRYIVLLIPLVIMLFPVFKAIGPVYRWRVRARIYRWYKYLREVDHQLDSGTLPEDLDADIKRLEEMEMELSKVNVPLSYSHELYELHMHVRYVIERLQALRNGDTEVDMPGKS